MGNSSNKSKMGGRYRALIYYDPEVDNTNKMNYLIKDAEVMKSLSHLTDSNQAIIGVSVFSNPLSKFQLTDMVLYHAFVIFITDDGWYWSIEKNTEGITIQRSKHLESVRDFYRRKKRNSNSLCKIKREIVAEGKGTIMDLANLIYFGNLLASRYNFIMSNCHRFAANVFTKTNKDGIFWNPGVKIANSLETFKSLYVLRLFLYSEEFQELYSTS